MFLQSIQLDKEYVWRTISTVDTVISALMVSLIWEVKFTSRGVVIELYNIVRFEAYLPEFESVWIWEGNKTWWTLRIYHHSCQICLPSQNKPG